MLLENIRDLSIGIAITILLPLTVYVGVRLISNPVYPKINKAIDKKEDKQIQDKKMEDYLKEQQKNEYYYFLINVIVGLIAVAIGSFYTNIPFLSMGFILGGIFCLLFGVLAHWQSFHYIVKFIALILALIFLIFAGVRLAKPK